MEDIKLPTITYEFGDKRFRALYGPEVDGKRQIVGFIDEDQVSRMEAIFDYADDTMKDTHDLPL